jgi:transposase
MSEKSTELNESQQLAIQLLASGKSCTAVSETIGVCKETISRWKRIPEFRAGLNSLVEDLWEFTRSRLANLAGPAMEVIESDLQLLMTPLDAHERHLRCCS